MVNPLPGRRPAKTHSIPTDQPLRCFIQRSPRPLGDARVHMLDGAMRDEATTTSGPPTAAAAVSLTQPGRRRHRGDAGRHHTLRLGLSLRVGGAGGRRAGGR